MDRTEPYDRSLPFVPSHANLNIHTIATATQPYIVDVGTFLIRIGIGGEFWGIVEATGADSSERATRTG